MSRWDIENEHCERAQHEKKSQMILISRWWWRFSCDTQQSERKEEINPTTTTVRWHESTYIYCDGNIKHRRREKDDQQSWWHKINFVCHAPVSSDVTQLTYHALLSMTTRDQRARKKLISKDSTERLMANNESFFIDFFPVLVRPERTSRLPPWPSSLCRYIGFFSILGLIFRLCIEMLTYLYTIEVQPHHHGWWDSAWPAFINKPSARPTFLHQWAFFIKKFCTYSRSMRMLKNHSSVKQTDVVLRIHSENE